MKTNTNIKKGSRRAGSPYFLKIKNLIVSALIFAGIVTTLQAQDVQYTKPTWWFGGAVGLNFNNYRGSTQQLNLDLTVPSAFHNGRGVGLYVAPLLEFHRPDTRLGFMLQVGYDGRKGSFNQIITACNCPADLDAKLSYITIEPSLRIAPFKSDFYLYGGPRFAFNSGKSFKYELGANPAYPDQLVNLPVEADFSNVYKTMMTLQIGAGYDIAVNSQNEQKQAVISPFIALHPYFNQDPRSIETWNMTTVRVGVALKFGRGEKVNTPVKVIPVAVVVVPDVKFSVNSPGNIPVARRVRETFPLRNYVFFDLGSSEIPDRYVLLTKDQVKDFKEDQLEVFKPKKLSGRSDRQMVVYYNVLNILGDRLGKTPSANVTLTGSSMEGKDDGLAMAESVKKYLINVFGIDANRIITAGRIKPIIPSEQAGGTKELELLRTGDRRVSITSDSPALLMEFQSGEYAPLRPVEILGMQEAPLDSYVTFNAQGARDAFSTWSLEVRDENNSLQNFGPYSQERVSIPGKSILGTRPSGDFKVTMVGKQKNGKTIKKEVPVHMVLWKPAENEEGMRFSIIFEINSSDAITMYNKYLTEIVTPKIIKDGTVIIHGHTDIIGDADHNMELSMARANEVEGILKSALTKAGRTDVKFEVYGFGEDEVLAPFNNNYPEERFYNRAVIIDIIPPAKK
jgi:outer membrane protein OmpA-like peptidoglycan-associated protein